MTIDGVPITDTTDAYVIAEVGHNHQGSVEKCQELIQAAKLAGASAVKLQKRDNRSLYTDDFYNKPYENENSFGPTYGAHREALEFGRQEYEQLLAVSKDLGITLFATAFDIPSADFLAKLEMPAYKIASGDIRNTPLLRHVAKIGKPMIISTGAATLDDVRRGYAAARAHNHQVAILQCTAGYPARFEELDLNVIASYRRVFPEAVIGLSAHDNGIAMAVAAYVLGGRIIEKHFTLNRAMKGTDHAFSLEPLGLQKMVRDLRRTRVALGSEQKRIYESEHPALTKMGKKLVASRDLPLGHRLRPEDIAIKSPGGGVQPYELDRLIGQRLTKLMRKDQAFELADLASLREVG
jgi:N-acetylneuraminate synthase/sialic acid synthase